MKKHELIFWSIKVPLDFCLVYISFFWARDIRLITDLIPWIKLPVRTITDNYLSWFAIFGSILFVAIYGFFWLYEIKINNTRFKQITWITKSAIIWFFLFIWCLYLGLGYIYTVEIPRLIILFTIFLSSFFVFIERTFLDLLHRKLLEKSILQKVKIALVWDKNISFIIENIKNAWIYDIVWYFSNNTDPFCKIKNLWNSKEFAIKAQNLWIEELLFINSSFSQEEIDVFFEYSRIFGIKYKYIANSFDFTKNNIETSFLGKIPIVEIRSIWLTPWWRVIKRIVDIIGSFFGLIFLAPLFLIVGYLIKKEDPDWPIIYENKRVWKNGKFFKLYKFRYMKWEYCTKDAYWIKPEEDKALEYEKKLIEEKSKRSWPLYKILDDPRKTKIGTFIEKYSIDELPQLINVLIWNMSLVWPRPHQPREVDLYKDYQKRVLTLKPWITWMAQTHWRHENDFDDEVRLDIFYIENWSLILDIKILIKTIKVMLKWV